MTIPQFQVRICSCQCCVVGVINYCFEFEIALFFSAELSQAVQGDGGRYGDCMMVANTPECLSHLNPSLEEHLHIFCPLAV